MGSIGSIRHLLYHIYPQKADGGKIWRRNVEELRKRMPLFNGRRVIGVALGPETDTMETVKAAFAGSNCKFIEKRNSRDMREATTLLALYESVADCVGPEHVTLHGHAKGITSEAWGKGVRRWVDALYETCLDYWPYVRSLLQTHPIAGPFKRQWSNWRVGNFTSKSTWHYSGSWRWFRNNDLFVRNWRYVEPFWCGSESHPSMVFRDDEAANIACSIDVGGQALYTEEFWRHVAGPTLDAWRSAHRHERQEPHLLTCVLVSHRKPIFVREAIASVERQSADEWELIVMDSGPLVDELRQCYRDPRIHVTCTNETETMRETTCCQGWATNECFRRGLVRGDLVCYLPDDDYYHPQAFEKWLAAARANPDQSAWCGQADRAATLPCGKTVKLGRLGNFPVGTLLDCKVDGMQVCHRVAVACTWPEDKRESWHADGMFLRALGERTGIYPINALVGVHRHTPQSTFTRTTAGGLVESKR